MRTKRNKVSPVPRDLRTAAQTSDPNIFIAAYSGESGTVESILLNNEDFQPLFDQHYMTPLHYAASQGHVEVCQILVEYRQDLLDMGDGLGNTGLHMSCLYGFIDVTLILLQFMALVNIKNLKGETPAHVAKNVETLRALKSYGADFEKLDNEENSVLYSCCIYNRVRSVQWILGGPKELSQRKSNLLQSSMISRSNLKGWNCFHAAAASNAVEVLEILTSSSLDLVTPGVLEFLSIAKQTPLMVALAEKNVEAALIIENALRKLMFHNITSASNNFDASRPSTATGAKHISCESYKRPSTATTNFNRNDTVGMDPVDLLKIEKIDEQQNEFEIICQLSHPFGDWMECKDLRTGQIFFYNEKDGLSQWKKPEAQSTKQENIAELETKIRAKVLKELEDSKKEIMNTKLKERRDSIKALTKISKISTQPKAKEARKQLLNNFQQRENSNLSSKETQKRKIEERLNKLSLTKLPEINENAWSLYDESISLKLRKKYISYCCQYLPREYFSCHSNILPRHKKVELKLSLMWTVFLTYIRKEDRNKILFLKSFTLGYHSCMTFFKTIKQKITTNEDLEKLIEKDLEEITFDKFVYGFIQTSKVKKKNLISFLLDDIFQTLGFKEEVLKFEASTKAFNQFEKIFQVKENKKFLKENALLWKYTFNQFSKNDKFISLPDTKHLLLELELVDENEVDEVIMIFFESIKMLRQEKIHKLNTFTGISLTLNLLVELITYTQFDPLTEHIKVEKLVEKLNRVIREKELKFTQSKLFKL